MKAFTESPDGVPTYPGELQAIRDVAAHGWVVYWHNSGFGHASNPIAVHRTNPASPMYLTSFETPGPRGRPPYHLLQWWWRPAIRIPHRPQTDLTRVGGVSLTRIQTYYPALLRSLARRESA